MQPVHRASVVFISSTTIDLRYHRAKAAELIARVGASVVTMADFDPIDLEPRHTVRIQVARADTYFLLLAWRYGAIPEGETRSYQEIEYDEAKRLGKPIYVFLADPATEAEDGNNDLFPADVRDAEHHAQLMSFRGRLLRERVVYFFTTPDDLANKIAERVYQMQQAPNLPEPDLSDTSKVFISYRRKDMPHAAGRIYDWLAWRFGQSDIFMDVQSIPGGEIFRPYIRKILAQCIVEIVVVGPQWSKMKDAAKRQRLSDPNDMVRVEVETGLDLDIVCIPVYLDGTEPPHPEDLPESLRPLCERNGMPVRDGIDFRGDVQRLIAAVERHIGPSSHAKGA